MNVIVLASLIGRIIAGVTSVTLDVATDSTTISQLTLFSQKGLEASIDMHEFYLKVPVSDAEMAELSALQATDGSWKDINYADEKRSQWEPMIHADRFQRLAIRWRRTGDRQALDMALRSHEYWVRRDPVCPNWWYNQIGCPKILGAGFVLLKDDMTREQLDGAIWVMGHSRFGMTGQNKVNQAWNCALRGLLSGDETLVREAREQIVSEIQVSDDIEGLQRDWSFHQHGPQLQMGNYGLSYAVAMSWWARVLKGTELAFPEDKLAIIENFVSKGLGQVVWRGYFDFAACGRQIFKNTQPGKGLAVQIAMANLGLGGVSLRPGASSQIQTGTPGAHLYPSSDFAVYRTADWYASIRMQSNRTKGFEFTNGENMKAYFSSDGELLLRRDGDEYSNLSPVWNWRHIPGATTYDDGTELWGMPGAVLYDNGDKKWKDYPYNITDKVFMSEEGDSLMIVAMEYNRDSLHARKAWFFCPEGIICLGAGISRNAPGEVFTTIEQNVLSGQVQKGKGWFMHRGVLYLTLDGQKIIQDPVRHEGSWRLMAPYLSDDPVAMDLFDIRISHGNQPSGASYAYAVLPGSSGSPAAAARSVFKRVSVLRNTPESQIVRIGNRTLYVDWSLVTCGVVE